MATADQVTGSALASQGTAILALKMLVRLGHADMLEDLKRQSLKMLSDSIEAAPTEQFDKDAAMEAGRQTIMGQFVSAAALTALDAVWPPAN